MSNIYNELRRHTGKLTEFSLVLVNKGLYLTTKEAVEALRNPTKEIVNEYEEWKPNKFKVKADIQKHNDKLNIVFRDMKRKSVKQELFESRDNLEQLLMDLILIIKKQDYSKLPELKETLQGILYGDLNRS